MRQLTAFGKIPTFRQVCRDFGALVAWRSLCITGMQLPGSEGRAAASSLLSPRVSGCPQQNIRIPAAPDNRFDWWRRSQVMILDRQDSTLCHSSQHRIQSLVLNNKRDHPCHHRAIGHGEESKEAWLPGLCEATNGGRQMKLLSRSWTSSHHAMSVTLDRVGALDAWYVSPSKTR